MTTPLAPITIDNVINDSTSCCEPTCCTPSATSQPATSDAIRENVRDRYAARARAVDEAKGASCCTPSGDTSTVSDGLYSTDELSNVPEDAASASLGCGNPTAIASLKPAKPCSISAPAAASMSSWPPNRWGQRASSTAWT